MSGSPICYGSLQACLLRVTKLTASGAPLTGAGHGIVSDALISLQVSVELQTGDELTQKDGCGNIAMTFKDCDRIKRLSFTMNLCQLDANLLSFLTETDVFSSGGNALGFQYPSVSAACPDGVCVEVWTKAWDGTEQATVSSQVAYWHWVFPKTNWVLGNVTMENALMVIPVTGQGSENTHITANGPYDDWPAAVANQGGVTRVGGVFLDTTTLPTAACSTITVTSAAS